MENVTEPEPNSGKSRPPGNKERGDRLSPPVAIWNMATTEFETVVNEHYEKLFRFAMSLVNNNAVAADLTQQTFYIYARKRGQIREAGRTKSWLFTTLHREFIALKRKDTRHPQYELDMMEHELPAIHPDAIRKLDLATMLEALESLDERFRVPLVLYHLDELSYREISEMLTIPIGTVMSRLARGRNHLFRLLHPRTTDIQPNIIELPAGPAGINHGRATS
jgi:RNA polymerase sigma-70 factor (ECF subfamily)